MGLIDVLFGRPLASSEDEGLPRGCGASLRWTLRLRSGQDHGAGFATRVHTLVHTLQ
jgi:hypothetical protein